MICRYICEADVERCLEIYNYYIENTTYTFEEKMLTYRDFKSRIDCISEKYPFLVAVEDNRILGYTYLNDFNERSAYRYTADLSIYVDKNECHKGIGFFLLNQIEDIARKEGIKNIVSVITDENFGSKCFHEKSGFKQVGRLENVGIKFNRWLSVDYYQKKL